ncbi:MAG: hypothetical protein RLZZ416_433 [Candidatus Parcubacteria bacterium]|jgi:hypothetical protein
MDIATTSFLQASSLLAHWPTDWFIVAGVAGLLAFDALRNGPARAATLALVLPTALMLEQLLAKAAYIGPMLAGFVSAYKELAIFGAMFVLLYFVIHRIVFTFADSGGPLPALIAGLCGAIVLIIVWLQIPQLTALWHFGPQVQAVFAESYRFWWLLVAYAGLAFARS